MQVYVVYVLSDYTCALGVTTDYNVAEQYANESHKRTGRKTWVDKININDELTELECD